MDLEIGIDSLATSVSWSHTKWIFTFWDSVNDYTFLRSDLSGRDGSRIRETVKLVTSKRWIERVNVSMCVKLQEEKTFNKTYRSRLDQNKRNQSAIWNSDNRFKRWRFNCKSHGHTRQVMSCLVWSDGSCTIHRLSERAAQQGRCRVLTLNVSLYS
jgi:hypothetical protein